MAAKFAKKPNVNEDEILETYLSLNQQIKELTAKLDPMKAIILPIVKARGGNMIIKGFNFTVASKPKLKYPDAIEAELKKLEDQQDFLAIKMKRAREDKLCTELSKGEYIVCKKAKEEE